MALRAYQSDADAALTAAGTGVVVLPCGAGKTLVGLAAIARLGCETLIVTSNQASVEQWQRELAAKTTLAPAQVGEYTGRRKQLRPVTVTTYQLLTSRPSRAGGFPHLDLFDRREWGLVIYDEVHLLPAPVFRATARIQARRRLGLTATLVLSTYVGQLRALAAELGAPIVTGQTPHVERSELYNRFRSGDLPVLCVSKVANFALDLPSAGVAIEISGTFGSRHEEAQRLGRLLRPKPGDNRAWFYTLVTRDSVEHDAAHRRQRFLAEQGYRYTVLGEEDVVAELPAAA